MSILRNKISITLLVAALAANVWASNPFWTIDAKTLGAKTLEAETKLGLRFGDDFGGALALPGLGGAYGITDRIDVGLSVLNWEIPTGGQAKYMDAEFLPVELNAKFALKPGKVAGELVIPLMFTTKDGDGFVYVARIAISLLEFININVGLYDQYKVRGESDDRLLCGVSFAPSFGPAFAGAEIDTGLNYDIIDKKRLGYYTFWRIGGGVNIGEKATVSAGFGGNLKQTSALNVGLGFSMRFGVAKI